MNLKKAINNIGEKIGSSKIVKNPVFLVIGLIVLVAIIVLIYFIFLKYSPIMNFKYGGYAISGKEITENLLGNNDSDNSATNKNIELTKIEEQGTIFKKLNSFFVGDKNKTEINLEYPIYINENSAIYNLSEEATLISKDFEEVSGYPNLSISEGKVYDGNNLERADGKEYIFVKTSEGIYINLQEIKLKTVVNEYTIPVNSIIAFTENSIRYYSVKNNVLVFNEINDVDKDTNVQIVENNYTYKDLLTRLGILKEEVPQNNGSNNKQINEEEENTIKTEQSKNNEGDNSDNSNENTNEIDNNANNTENTNNIADNNQNTYVKPEVGCEEFAVEVYTATSTLHINDPAGRIIEAPTFEIYKDGKIYLRRVYTNSGTIQITGLLPNTEFEIKGKYVYLNENGQKIENQFYDKKFTTKGYEALGSIEIAKENGEIYSNKIQIQKLKITSDLNAEVLKGVNQVEIVTGDIRTVLKNNQINELLQGKEITIESSEGLESDRKIDYEIKFYDRNGVELKVNNNKGETRTSKQRPEVRVSIKEQNIVSVTLNLRLTNKDNVKLENYKYIVTKPNGEKVREEKLAENEKELLLEDLDQNQYYTITIYADFDLNDNRGKQENVEIGSLVFATQPISTLGSLDLNVENKELTGNSSTIDYTINEDRTDKRLIQILNELTIKIVEQPSNTNDSSNNENNINTNAVDEGNSEDEVTANDTSINKTNKEPIVVYTNTLTGDEITNLQQGNTKEIRYENLKSNTRYTIEITGEVKLGETEESIPITYTYKEFITLKIPAKVEIKNQFVTGNLIDFDVRIEDVDKSVLNEKVRMELRDEKDNLIDLQEITTNQDFIRKTYEKLEENHTYKLSFYADQYNEGSTDETYKINYLIKEIEIVTEPGISGQVGLTELTRKATGKNLVDMSSETKWYVYPNFNTNDYYGKEYDQQTKVLTLGGHGNWRRAVYDLREYAGKEVTMSFKAKNVNGSQGTYIQNSKTDTNRIKIEGLTNEWKDFQYTLTLDKTGYLGFYIIGGNGIQIKELQIELGDKKTSYEEFRCTLESKYTINLEDKRDEITTNDYYLKIYEDENLIKTDRYEEIPESNVITNAIKSYDTESGKEYKVELVIKVNDREYTISSLEYNTKDTEEIKGIYNKEDYLEIQPRGHYIVLGDIDLSDGIGGEQYRFGNGNLAFEGVIDFNGKKIINTNKNSSGICKMEKTGIIKNLVYEAHYITNNISFYGYVDTNYGNISNVQINIYSNEDFIGSKDAYKYAFININHGTFNKFIINIKNEINIISRFATVGFNFGEIKNGYVYGEKINSNYDIEESVYKDIGVVCYSNTSNGTIKNIYSTIDIELSNGNYHKNASAILDFNQNSIVKNVYSTGKIINSDISSYGINVSRVESNGRYQIENSYYMSEDTYKASYDKKTTKLALYDVEFQEKILNEENCFEIEENVRNGYYPQLNLNECMPSQEYISLPKVEDADLPDIIDSEIIEQTSSTAKVKFKVNNPTAETITDIKIKNMSCKILEQEYNEGQSTIIAELYDPIICVSEYSVISISTKGAYNQEYTRTFQDNERILQLDMYKEIRTIDEWNNIKNSLTENYMLMNDLDFINNGIMAKVSGTYRGKINGNNHTIKNIILNGGTVFGTISNTSKILNLNIQNYQSVGTNACGLIYTLNGEVNNVHIINESLEKTNYSMDNHTGGLVSVSYGFIYNSSVSNLVIKNHTYSTVTRVGGLVGIAIGGEVSNCYAKNIDIDVKENISYDGIGGLIGNIQSNSTRIKNCYVTGNINTDAYEVGGIVGYLGSGSIEKCYSTVNIYTEDTAVGGIVGKSNSDKVNSNVFLGTIYSSGKSGQTNALCPNKDISNNYVYEEVTINGYLVDNSYNIVTKEELKSEYMYLNKIGLGTEFCYDEIENGKLPLLYKEGTTELLAGQEPIDVPTRDEIYIEAVESEKSSINEMQAIITINNPNEDNITNISIENMEIISKNIVNRNGKTYITLTAKPTGFYNSYKIDSIEIVQNEIKQTITTGAKIDIKFYKELYNVSDWQSIEDGTYQNYMLMNDIDFNNMENIKYNVTMQELVTNNNETYTLKNIKINLKEGNSGIIRKVNILKNINFENIQISKSAQNSRTGVIVANQQISNCNFNNVNIDAKNSDYVGCIVNSTTSSFDNIKANEIKIKGKNYVGGIIPYYSGVMTNIKVSNLEVSGLDNVAGIVGNGTYTGGVTKSEATEIKVQGNNYVGGIIGGIEGNSASSAPDRIYNCNIKNGEIKGTSYVGGIAGQCSVYASSVKNSYVYGENYVGGVAGTLLNSYDEVNYIDNVKVKGIYDYIGRNCWKK